MPELVINMPVMQKLFNKILVPVDFSRQSDIAVEKAVQIAVEYRCSIHLLHAISVEPFAAMAAAGPYLLTGCEGADNYNETAFHLKKICDRIITSTEGVVKASCHILLGSWTQSVIDLVNETGADLVLTGQKNGLFMKGKTTLNPDTVAEKTNVPVITLPPGGSMPELSSVLIPVTNFLPLRKLIYGVYFAAHYNAVIRLLAIGDHSSSSLTQHYLQRSYQLIKENCTLKTELEIAGKGNIAGAISGCTKAKPASLVIVNPRTQTRMPGLVAALTGNILQKHAAQPVLTVTQCSNHLNQCI